MSNKGEETAHFIELLNFLCASKTMYGYLCTLLISLAATMKFYS